MSWIRKMRGSYAWTSSTSDHGRIINTNSGKQGDLISGVAGDVIQHVGGNVFKGVGRDVINVYSDYIYGEEKIRLPKFVVLKSKCEGRCLRLTENDGSLPTGFLKFEGSEVATEKAKFELVPSKSGKELVHLRCCYNNKYLVRYTGALGTTCSSLWIVAAADKPEEDKFKISCTLFKLEPVNIEGLEFRFFHIQLEKHACLWTCSKPAQYFGGLHGGSGTPDKDVFNVYTVVAWESLEEGQNVSKFTALASNTSPKSDDGQILATGVRSEKPTELSNVPWMLAFNINFGKQDHVVTGVRGNFNTQEQNLCGNFNKQEQYVHRNKKHVGGRFIKDVSGGDVINDSDVFNIVFGDFIKDVRGDIIKDVRGDIIKEVRGDVIKDVPGSS